MCIRDSNGDFHVTVHLEVNGEVKEISGSGNGRLDAASNAMKQSLGLDYTIFQYQEHALEQGSTSQAAAYVGIADKNGKVTWGAGIHTDIVTASIMALVSAINRSQK